jgi:hypothetical protein
LSSLTRSPWWPWTHLPASALHPGSCMFCSYFHW